MDKVEFNRYNANKYAADVKKYTGEKGAKEVADYWNFIFNAAARYVETGDATHWNNAVSASRNMGRFRQTLRIMPCLSAHKFDRKSGLVAEGTKASKKKLDSLRENWEELFTTAFEKEEEHGKKMDAKAWNIENYAHAVLANLKKHGADLGDFNKALLREKAKAEAEAKAA